ncbi:hypothetical protein NQ318_007926 [Aromia moschata]|uniref:Uncharacterized protein n=1 Tax=Aromia moschata TaxID=1265417 RepID=A0AAV8Y1G7_9CUCU|nr:hypothetical protein NQ318_007926 [Aromia moschata]
MHIFSSNSSSSEYSNDRRLRGAKKKYLDRNLAILPNLIIHLLDMTRLQDVKLLSAILKKKRERLLLFGRNNLNTFIKFNTTMLWALNVCREVICKELGWIWRCSSEGSKKKGSKSCRKTRVAAALNLNVSTVNSQKAEYNELLKSPRKRNPTCGQPNKDHRIVGGKPAAENEYPWMARLS